MFRGWWTKSTFVRGWSCSGAGGQSQHLLEVDSCSVADGQSQHWLEVGHVSDWWTKSTLVRGWSCSVADGTKSTLVKVGHVQGLVDKVNIC